MALVVNGRRAGGESGARRADAASMIKLAKERPAKLTYGSGGTDRRITICRAPQEHDRIELTHLPYQGSVPALNEVVAGGTT